VSAAEDYLLLGLRLGRHVDGLVDAYYGPPELKEQVDAEEPAPAEQLAADGDALRDRLADGWLRDQVAACAAYAHVLAGDELSYADEVARCYGVRPERTPTSVYEAAHARLDELLPGEGSLTERRRRWREQHQVSGEVALRIVEDLMPVLRELTTAIVGLPAGESVGLEAVSDEPWWAFNYYRGDLRSDVVLNTDVPTTSFDVIHLVAHEIYPGHHTEHAVKEQRLLRDAGKIEEGIQLVPTPQAVVSEGIAETGAEVALAEGREPAYAVLRKHGVDMDFDLAEQLAEVGEQLRPVGLDAALMIHDEGASLEEAQAYIERWSLVPPDRAKHSIAFATDPTWRAYVITYTAGRDLCRAFVGDDRDKFRTLLTEHVRISDLVATT
jgi:hypothetical protein